MPPHSPPQKFSFFYGHRKPSRNRPTVRGSGLFSNRLSPPKPKPKPSAAESQPFELSKWHPRQSPPSTSSNPTATATATTRSLSFLSPIARFVLDAFRKNRNHWGPPVVLELQKLRRVTPDLVAEVLKVQDDAVLASKFFHWADVGQQVQVKRGETWISISKR